MARRCLQRVIREAHPTLPTEAKQHLTTEIDWEIANGGWDQEVMDALADFHKAGNFASLQGNDRLDRGVRVDGG